jgi:tetratricopeptide (TPR) repeat protein
VSPVGRVAVLLMVILGVAAHGPAYAQATAPQGEARALAQQAKAAFDAGDFTTASKLLERAYGLKPWPVFLYNLGRTYQQAGSNLQAVSAYERYLSADPRSPDAGAVKESIRQLKEQIERDQTLAQAAQAANLRVARETEERQRAVVAMEQAQAEAREAAARHKASPWPWVVAGAGLGAIAAGSAFGALTSSAHGQAVADSSATQAASDQSSAATYALVANVLFIAGASVAAAGTVWGIFDLRVALASPQSPGAHGRSLPTALVLGGTF